MKSINVLLSTDGYHVTYVDNNGAQHTLKKDLVDEKFIKLFKPIEEFIGSQKTEQEILIEQLEKQNQVAFNFVKENATDEQKLEMIDMYPDFKSNHDYIKGDEFKFQGNIYRVLQDHNSGFYRPDEAVSLYVNINNKVSLEEFKQPEGSHDAYMINDRVIFEGSIYVSLIDNNVWSPRDYPQGWQKEGE